jgi:hypothetical protein
MCDQIIRRGSFRKIHPKTTRRSDWGRAAAKRLPAVASTIAGKASRFRAAGTAQLVDRQ